jgi:Ni/Co efflux regulator RcnB
MRRFSSIAAIFALALPTLAMAQANQHRPAGRPAARPAPHAAPIVRARVVRRPVVHTPVVHTPVVRTPVVRTPVVRTPVGRRPVVPAHVGPVRVGTPYLFRGRPYAWHPIRFPHPWVYPQGYAYRLWAVGAILPPLFWSSPTYYYTDWDAMGLPPPDPGFQYVQYGPDLLLVNIATGEVVQVFPGAFN